MTNFHQLYEKYAADVYRFAYWLSGNAAEAEDITSETFIRAWTSRKTLHTETLKGYLFTIARNLYLKQLRQDKRHMPLVAEYTDRSPSPETITADRWELTAALQAVAQLPEVDRAALILRIHHELPYTEIGRVLNISTAAAKVKVHRARLKLAAERQGEELP